MSYELQLLLFLVSSEKFYKQQQQVQTKSNIVKQPMITIASIKQEISLSEPQFTQQQKRQLTIKLREMPPKDRLNYIHKELRTIIVTLLLHKTLNQQKLLKLLSINIPFNQAMQLNLTNHYSYIMNLIRKNTTSTARTFLNQLTDHINRYEDTLHKKIEKEVKVYRQLDRNINSCGSDSSESEVQQKSRYRSKKQKTKLKDRQKKGGVITNKTFISGGKLVRKEQLTCVQADSAFIPFTRITKQK